MFVKFFSYIDNKIYSNSVFYSNFLISEPICKHPIRLIMQPIETLSQRDARVLWHPFTQMKTAQLPIAIVRGEGARLYDEQGKMYIDGIASWWMNLHGHAHPYIAQRLAEQAATLEHVIFANFTHQPAVELAERLLAYLPDNQKRIFYSDNGSTAVEVAIKMCLQYWHNQGTPRRRFVAFADGYHGDTFGAMSVGARSVFNQPFERLLFEITHIDTPAAGREEAAIEQLERALKSGEIAGFIFEPLVQGAAGMQMHTAEGLDTMLALCKKYGVLCIADEVMTGFYKTGKFLATDACTNAPDIICLSKGLTAGTMALGATSCTEAVFQAFWSDDRRKTFFHGHSCTANPLACVVGLASLDLLERPETQANLQRIITQQQQFVQRLGDFAHARNPRQMGVIAAFEWSPSDEGASYLHNQTGFIWEFFIQRGLILRPLGNTIYVLPPYCITESELEALHNGIFEFLACSESGKWQQISDSDQHIYF